jgi:hypothetical protein
MLVKGLEDGKPLITSDPEAFSGSDFYLPHAAASRVYYVYDEGLHPQDLVDQIVRRGAKTFSLQGHVADWQTFVQEHPQFLLHVDDTYSDWLYSRLLDGGWRVDVKDREGIEVLYQISRPATSTTQLPPAAGLSAVY